MDDGTCSFPGCDKPIDRRRTRSGRCRGHNAQLDRKEQLRPLKPRSANGTHPPCEVCGQPSMATQLCSMHYQRLKKAGTTESTRRGRQPCQFQGCTRLNDTRGYCVAHNRQLRRGGPLEPIGAKWATRTSRSYADAQLRDREADAPCWTDWPHGWSNHDIPRPVVHVRGKGKVLVARYVFFAVNGYWPTWACHRCPEHPNGEDGQCWNPAHIYDGDPATNGMDRRGTKTWKPQQQPTP